MSRHNEQLISVRSETTHLRAELENSEAARHRLELALQRMDSAYKV